MRVHEQLHEELENVMDLSEHTTAIVDLDPPAEVNVNDVVGSIHFKGGLTLSLVVQSLPDAAMASAYNFGTKDDPHAVAVEE